MTTIDEIKIKYHADDAFSKGLNNVGHELKRYSASEKLGPKETRKILGMETARAFANANKFKNAGVEYRSRDGWHVFGRLSGYMTPTEAQAYAQDLLKAVAAIKKAPAIKK